MNAIRTKLALACALVFALVLGGCGGGGGGCENPTDPGCPPSPSPPPTPRPPVVLDGANGGLPAFVALFRTLATTETGSFEVVVDWTFPTNDIDILLFRGPCSFDQFISGSCAIAAAETSMTAKPERLRLANQPAGTYTLVIPNYGPEDESISYQVIFTPGTSAAAASQGPAFPLDKVRALRRGIARH